MTNMKSQPLPHGIASSDRAASKYDFVKIKVWVGEDMAHYYVLSRFQISRTLTVTKVPLDKAVRIALDVKKFLVDNDRRDTTQAELEAILFGAMRSRGYGDEYIARYKMVNKFMQSKRPLVILICGTACTGTAAYAQELSSRLNLSNVLQTDLLYELLHGSEWNELASAPLWDREGLEGPELVAEFRKEARAIRRGLEGDLTKTIKDGKPIIIEGMHLDPGLYLDEFGRQGAVGMGGLSPAANCQACAEGHDAAEANCRATATAAAAEEGPQPSAFAAAAAEELEEEAGPLPELPAALSGLQLQPGGFLHRLLSQQLPLPSRPSAALPRRGSLLRSQSTAGQVTFMLRQPSDAAATLVPTPVLPGTELVLPIAEEEEELAGLSDCCPFHWASAADAADPARTLKKISSLSPFQSEAPAPAAPAVTAVTAAPAAAAATAKAAAVPKAEEAEKDPNAMGGGGGPVFVPLVLTMGAADYELTVTEWQAAQGADAERSAAVLGRLKALQGYLAAYEEAGVPVVNVDVENFEATLERLHDYLLKCMEMSTST